MSFAPRRICLRSSAPHGARPVLRALLLLASCALLFPTPSQAQSRTSGAAARPGPTPRPATLADYRGRVRVAAELLEEMAAMYDIMGGEEEGEQETDAGAGAGPSSPGEDAESVSQEPEEDAPEEDEDAPQEPEDALPPSERVEWGAAGFVEVDNAWMYEALEEAEAADDDRARAELLRAAAERLRSLEARLAELDGGVRQVTDRDAERGRLNAILSAPEFSREARQQRQQQRQQGGAVGRFIREFFDWVLSLLPEGPRLRPGASPQVSLLTQILVGAVCLAVLAWVARLLWLRRGQGSSLKLKRGPRVVLGERLEEDKTAADLLEEAERLARAGDVRGAIRRAYVALLCELGDRGVVRLGRHKTNRDYLSAVRHAAPPGLYTEMLPLTFDFEVHWYGLRDASDADWESFKERCRRAIAIGSRQ